jgi:hypothetical protein
METAPSKTGNKAAAFIIRDGKRASWKKWINERTADSGQLLQYTTNCPVLVIEDRFIHLVVPLPFIGV